MFWIIICSNDVFICFFVLPFQRRDRLYTSESDICRRQILTFKDSTRAEKNEIFIMVVNP